jgi:hypothetical protein
MTRTSHWKQPSSEELLERGRLALEAIRFREQIARCQAEALQLQAAMNQAEGGDLTSLENWLKLNTEHSSSGHLQNSPAESVNLTQQGSSDSAPTSDTAKIIRIDAAQPLDHSLPNPVSPWARMEKAAMARLQSGRDPAAATQPIPPGVPPEDCNEPTNYLVSESLGNLLAVLNTEPKPFQNRRLWFAPHVWISVLVHLLLVLGLSAVIGSTVLKPQNLAIVSSVVEAEHVLTETPMELNSELDPAVEPIATVPTPDLSNLTSEIALPLPAMDQGLGQAATASVSAEVGSSSIWAQNLSGSKLMAGAEFFGVKAVGNTFIYIVDNSPSMRRDGAFEAAKKELSRSLSTMKPKQRFLISFFGKEIETMAAMSGAIEKYPVYAIPENLSRTFDWLSKVLVQKDGWPPNEALGKAIEMQPDAIFLLFDGDTKADVAKFLRSKNRTDDLLSAGAVKVPIHVVHFFEGEFQKQMKQVADENDGTYRFVPRPSQSKN